MDNVKAIYGSCNGNTERAARKIAEALGGVALSAAEIDAKDLQEGFLILGTSTWGLGELQDDWAAKLPLLDQADFKGRKAAVFGLGDQQGFPTSFVDGMGTLAAKLKERGALLVGSWSKEGYSFDSSTALDASGRFEGLALDEDSQADLSESRIAAWTEQLKKEA